MGVWIRILGMLGDFAFVIGIPEALFPFLTLNHFFFFFLRKTVFLTARFKIPECFQNSLV